MQVDNVIEVFPEQIYVREPFFIVLTVFLCLAAIFATRLILNKIMRKKGVLPPTQFHPKKLNLIFIGVAAIIFIAVYLILYFVSAFQHLSALENIIFIALTVSLLSYIAARKILQLKADK